MIYLADANFLIYCWRNAAHAQRLEALRPLLDSEIRLVWLVKAEFLRGAVMARHDPVRVQMFLGQHKTVWPNEETLALYAETYARLVRSNQMIGPHDLWIATSALQHKLPLLTHNTSEFRRVAGVKVIDYLGG